MAATDGGEGLSPVLRDVLLQARAAGFLGPGEVTPQYSHAQGFVAVTRRQAENPSSRVPRILDLGSGGGLPGLVLALEWPEPQVVLLDAQQRRTDFLDHSVERLGLGDRVSVVTGRAEACGRDETLRGSFDGVVVRSFGPPAVVAECAAPFLRMGGWLIVSEPPGAVGQAGEGTDPGAAKEEVPQSPRWPAEPLAQFGLEPVEFVHQEFGYQVLRQIEACPERFPRRDGVPARKPLF